MSARAQPYTILIAALGGEGGGLLTDWVVNACIEDGLLVQSTSIPGVAQRTGATTYYLEIARAGEDGREPVFALYPAPAQIDMVVASELVEAGRAIEMGFVSPDRTSLIASNHRIFAIVEKSSMSSAAFDHTAIVSAAKDLSRRHTLTDFTQMARDSSTALNAVLLGAMAGDADMPVSEQAFEAAIRARGVAVEANIRGFRAGLETAAAGTVEPAREDTSGETPGVPDGFVPGHIPAGLRDVVGHALGRLTDYQDEAYARLYIERLDRLLDAEQEALPAGETDYAVSHEGARQLALWMTYEDVIRVADLKSRASRFSRVRGEAGAKKTDIVRVTEFLKPGLDEALTILPAGLGRTLRRRLPERLRKRFNMGLRVRSDTVTGYLALRFVARLRGRRRKGLRYAEEHQAMQRWWSALCNAAARDRGAALEIARAARLVKGYSDTRERAMRNFDAIMDRVVDPALQASIIPPDTAGRVAGAVSAALADEDGIALRAVLDAPPEVAAEPVADAAQ